MPECHCDQLNRQFGAKVADDDVRDYRRHGAVPSTLLLLDALRRGGVADRTLLDIGGGVGVISLELLANGLASATDVDVSAAYIAAARREAEARGVGDRVAYIEGDFVDHAGDVAPADIVTLDRVVCCYPDLDALVARSAQRAVDRLGVVHPHDRWWIRWGLAILNLAGRPFRSPRFFVHPTRRLEEILAANGLEREWQSGTRIWRVAVYRRVGLPPATG